MELQELRQKLSEAGFSEEVATKLDGILERAVASGALSEADKAEMMELIDIDIEAGNLEADAMENMALMLDSYVSETEALVKANETEEEKIAADADTEATTIEAELTAAQTEPEQPASPWSLPAAETPVSSPAFSAPADVVPETPVVEAPAAEIPAVPQWNQPNQ